MFESRIPRNGVLNSDLHILYMNEGVSFKTEPDENSSISPYYCGIKDYFIIHGKEWRDLWNMVFFNLSLIILEAMLNVAKES